MTFTLFIGVLLWFFQTTFLNSFYIIIKEQELRNAANHISEYIDDDELYAVTLKKVRNIGADILISTEEGRVILKISQIGSDSLNRFSREACVRSFAATVNEGGERTVTIIHNLQVEPFENEAYKENRDSNFGFFVPFDKIVPNSIVFSKVVESENSSPKLIMLIVDMAPLDSTVETLRFQLVWVTGIMVCLSLVLAIFLSRTLSKPIVSINKKAAKLAKGEFDIEFEESGTKEINELANTLNYASHELTKVDKYRKELIANVSHDLRTPLTMITGYSEVMRDIPGENTPENMQVIIDEANRLSMLVKDLLDTSKLETGMVELNKEKFSITKTITDILTRYEKLTDYKISFEYSEEAFVFADKLKISQVIYNLINNAVTYTGEDKCVFVTQTVENREVKISVRDTGEGISEENLPYVWDRYYKIDKNHKRASIGTGLGLSIVKNILNLHGGRYGVISKPNAGSIFYFVLNLSSEIL